jgi:hypothetical protein
MDSSSKQSATQYKMGASCVIRSTGEKVQYRGRLAMSFLEHLLTIAVDQSRPWLGTKWNKIENRR